MMSTHTEQQQTVITDVRQFFNRISARYQQLEQRYINLCERIPLLTPLQIEEECSKITAKQQEMTEMDNKLIEIITLAGQELSNEQIVLEYRVAFAKAVMACENLQQELSALKLSFQ